MNTVISILLSVFVIIILVTVFKVSYRKNVHVKRNGRNLKINDIQVEYSDLQHYIDTKNDFEQSFFAPTVDITTELNEEIPEIINYHIDEDVQNVHDNMIQKNIKNVYCFLPKTQQEFSSLKEEIIRYIKDDERAEKVEEILNKIEKRNAFVTNLNSDETSVVKNVFFSGNENVRNQLVNELLDCVDDKGILYCPTGVTSRISSALHIDNPEKAPKTKEILNQEVMATFGKHFTELPDKNMAKEKTIQEYYQVYPRDDILNLINEWIDYV